MSAAKKNSRHKKNGKKRKNLKRKIKIIRAIRSKKSKKYKKNNKKSYDERKSKRSHDVISSSGEKIKVFHTMRTRFSLIIFVLFAITGVTTALLFYLLRIITLFEEMYLNVTLLVAAMAFSCIIIGTLISLSSTKLWFGRVALICEAMREVAKGKFSTRVEEKDSHSTKNTPTELGDLERTFNQMASDLEGIEMFRNDFINNFSHEFKTPIVSIRGFARQLQSGKLSEEQQKEYINVIVAESERLATMSQNVLLLTKLETQTIVSEKTEFYLDEQIRHCILLLDKSWNEKNIEFDLDMDEVKYVFNEEMLSHIWINLLSNAIKFTPDNGTISCKLKESNENIVFEIKDNGIGMTKEVCERIFEKFYQGDTSHATKGNGIGLNIVQRIIKLAGGSIEVKSQPNIGSTFTVNLNKSR